MKTPEGYKLISVGRQLQRRAEEMKVTAERMTKINELGASAMTMIEAQNTREVGDWLVEKGKRGIKS